MLSSYSAGDAIQLPAMVIDEAVTVPSDIKLFGAKLGVDAVDPSRSDDEEQETVFTTPVKLSGNVSIDGAVFKAKPDISEAEEVTIKNSRFVGISVDKSGNNAAKSVLGTAAKDVPKVMNIEGCYFGDGENVYNVFELTGVLKDGSSIKNNYFSAAVGSHNVINLYAIEDGATIDIADNYFEKSASAARIGVKGDVKRVTINFTNNTYDTTDSDLRWAGLITIQPYGKQTVSMGDITVNIDGTINNSGIDQLFCYYEGRNDAELDYVNRPMVYINGARVSEEEYNLCSTIDRGA